MELDGTPTNITLPHKMFLGMDFYLWRWPEKEHPVVAKLNFLIVPIKFCVTKPWHKISTKNK